MLWWTGEIKADSDPPEKDARPPTTVGLSLGIARLSLHYVFEDIVVGGVRSLARIPVPTLSVELQEPEFSANADGILDSVASDLDDLLRVLSFLSRRHVGWTRTKLTSKWVSSGEGSPDAQNSTAGDYHEAERLRVYTGSRPRASREPLVNAYRLAPDALETILGQYRASEFKDAAGIAIIYMMAARNEEFVEGKLAGAFTALEALVNGIGEVRGTVSPLTPSAYRALSKQLRAVTRSFAEHRGLDVRITNSLIAKLSELIRRPMVERLAEVLIDEGVVWDDLWSEGTELIQALRQLYARRNRFVHGGHLESVSRASIDARRVIILAERMLYKLLGGRAEWQDWSSYRDADYLVAEERLLNDARPSEGAAEAPNLAP
jgi:hypothetical protein